MAKRNNIKKNVLSAIAVSFIAATVNILFNRYNARLQELLKATGWADMHTEALRNPFFFVGLFLSPLLCCMCFWGWEKFLSQRGKISEHIGIVLVHVYGLSIWDMSCFVRSGPSWAEDVLCVLKVYLPYATTVVLLISLYRSVFAKGKGCRFVTVVRSLLSALAWIGLVYTWWCCPGMLVGHIALAMVTVCIGKIINERRNM